MKTHLLAGATLAALLSTTTARADGTAPAAGAAGAAGSPATAAPAEAPGALDGQPAQALAPAPPPVRPDRGRFSGKRLVVEMLAGAAVGALVGVGTYKAAGGGDSIGAVFAGLGAQIVVTPLVTWGTGRAMGGRGTLGFTYLGGLIAFSGPSATTEQAVVSFAVGMTLMPITSALAFELSSHVRSKRFEAVAGGLAIAPIADRHGITGVQAGLAFGF